MFNRILEIYLLIYRPLPYIGGKIESIYFSIVPNVEEVTNKLLVNIFPHKLG